VPRKLKFDLKRYKQILYNLLGNAVKFTVEGSISIRVWFEECTLYTEVRDTGIGIKEEDQPKLFKMFGKLNDPGKLN